MRTLAHELILEPLLLRSEARDALQGVFNAALSEKARDDHIAVPQEIPASAHGGEIRYIPFEQARPLPLGDGQHLPRAHREEKTAGTGAHALLIFPVLQGFYAIEPLLKAGVVVGIAQQIAQRHVAKGLQRGGQLATQSHAAIVYLRKPLQRFGFVSGHGERAAVQHGAACVLMLGGHENAELLPATPLRQHTAEMSERLASYRKSSGSGSSAANWEASA